MMLSWSGLKGAISRENSLPALIHSYVPKTARETESSDRVHSLAFRNKARLETQSA